MKVNRLPTLFCLIILISCNNNQAAVESLNKQIDSLNTVISNLNAQVKASEKENTLVKKLHAEASTCTIIHYKPKGLEIKLHSLRPAFNDTTFLSVPAAFTSPQTTIDGVFIENGKVVNNTKHESINGFVLFKNNELTIDELTYLTDSIIATAIAQKYNLFQQFLLVKNSKIVDCTIFKDAKNVRRAIIKYMNGEVFIAESNSPVTILEFQSTLVEIGVRDAIYLDMGTWSEGWYKSSDYEKIKIGEDFSDTNKQTNWLTFERTADY